MGTHKNSYPAWKLADDIPFCHMTMGSHLTTFGGMRTFQMMKPWKKSWDNEDLELEDLEVRFVFCLLADWEPQELMSRVVLGWGELGGTKAIFEKSGCLQNLHAGSFL